MRWTGIALALVGVAVAIGAWFGFENVPFLIGGSIFAVIGMIVFMYGTRTLPK